MGSRAGDALAPMRFAPREVIVRLPSTDRCGRIRRFARAVPGARTIQPETEHRLTAIASTSRPLAARAARIRSGPGVVLWAVLALFVAFAAHRAAAPGAASPPSSVAVRALGHDPPRVEAPRPHRLTPAEASAGRHAGGVGPHAPFTSPATPRSRWVAGDLARPFSLPRYRPGRPDHPAHFANPPPAANG